MGSNAAHPFLGGAVKEDLFGQTVQAKEATACFGSKMVTSLVAVEDRDFFDEDTDIRVNEDVDLLRKRL